MTSCKPALDSHIFPLWWRCYGSSGSCVPVLCGFSFTQTGSAEFDQTRLFRRTCAFLARTGGRGLELTVFSWFASRVSAGAEITYVDPRCRAGPRTEELMRSLRNVLGRRLFGSSKLFLYKLLRVKKRFLLNDFSPFSVFPTPLLGLVTPSQPRIKHGWIKNICPSWPSWVKHQCQHLWAPAPGLPALLWPVRLGLLLPPTTHLHR